MERAALVAGVPVDEGRPLVLEAVMLAEPRDELPVGPALELPVVEADAAVEEPDVAEAVPALDPLTMEKGAFLEVVSFWVM